MAEGDAYISSVTLLDDGYALLKSDTVGIEIVIHNIYVPQGYTVEVYHYYNSSPAKEILLYTTSTSLCGYCFHANDDGCIKVVNVSGSTIDVGFDGVETSE